MTPTARHLLSLLLLTVVAATGGCRTAQPTPTPAPAPAVPTPMPAGSQAPWSAAPLARDSVPPVYLTAWRAAENRAHCVLVAPVRVDGSGAVATPRIASFGGGWGIAYDLPELRSAFGVAGTGAKAWEGDVYDAWPERRTLADGSRIGYGPEGSTGPNWLAYVRIPGQDCLYNVWSRLGKAHLEGLIGELRFVNVIVGVP